MSKPIDGRTGHCNRLNRKRAHTPHSLGKSEKAITDSHRIKQDAEATKAAGMWARGMDRENRQ